MDSCGGLKNRNSVLFLSLRREDLMDLIGKFSKFIAWPRNLSVDNKGRYYRKSLIMVILAACLPSALIGAGTYLTGVKQVEKEVNQAHRVQLQQVYKRVDEQLQQIEIAVNRWAFNPVFGVKLRNVDLASERDITLDIYKTLLLMQGSSPLIADAGLYLSAQGCLVSESNGIIRIEKQDLVNTYQNLLKMERFIFWADSVLSNPGSGSEMTTSLVHKLPAGSSHPYGALIVRINKKQFDDMIGQLNPNGMGAAFILHPQGNWITNGRGSKKEYPLDIMLREKVLGSANHEDSFIYKQGGEKFAVAYVTIERTGWRFVTATPLSKITAPVEFISRLILFISLAGILIAFLFSWFTSRKIYSPIGRLAGMFGMGSQDARTERDEFQYIESQWIHLNQEKEALRFEREKLIAGIENDRYHLRNVFILQLIQGYLQHFSENELKNRLEQFGWSTQDCCFIVMLAQMSIPPDNPKMFVKGDEQLVSFAAANMIEEATMEMRENVEVVNFNDLSVAVLLKVPSAVSREQSDREIDTLCDRISETLVNLLAIQVTIGVSRKADCLRDINTAFEQTRQLIRYRDMSLNRQILRVEDLIPQNGYAADYPLGLEKEIVYALRMGNEEEAVARLGEFMKILQEKVGKEVLVQQALVQLLGSILHMVLQSGMDTHSLYRGRNLYEQLLRMRDLNEIRLWFETEVIHPYIAELEETQGMQLKQLVLKVQETIESKYMTELSLDSCADQFGTYPKRLSVVFAQVTGKNFIDYLTDVRMEKAKELLCNTDEKINDIAERVGYKSSYFNRIFKKHEGITPGEFREKCG